MKYFKPDIELHHFSDINQEWLIKHETKSIFSDLDSTLAVHDKPGDDDLKNWIKMLKENDVQLIIVSNNSQKRVDRFCKPFNIIGFGRCRKPSPQKIGKYIKEVHALKSTSLFLGDQLLTDIWCGKLLNIKTVLVKPIGREHEPVQINVKRKLENWIKKKW